jgi:hypothetical protein
MFFFQQTEKNSQADQRAANCAMILFPHYIDAKYGEPTFPETLRDPKLMELFKIVQFKFKPDLKIFKFCDTVNGVEAVHISVMNSQPPVT